MNEVKNVALVGFGRISERHVAAIRAVPGLHLSAVVEMDTARRSKAQDMGFATFESVDTMFQEGNDVDLVSVLTPSGTHFEQAMRLLKYNVPVILEKPLTLSYSEAWKLVESFGSQNVPLFVVKQNRLNPPVRKVLEKINSGGFGKVLFVSASVIWARHAEYYLQDKWRLSRTMDGGVIWNQASHYVDLLVQTAGRIESVFAYGANFLSPADTDDTVFAIFKSENGALVSIQATTTARPTNFEGTLLVSSEKGVMKVGGHALNTLVADSFAEITHSDGGHLGASDSSEVYGQSHGPLYLEILEDLSKGQTSQFRAASGLHLVAVMEAIHNSISLGREVRVSELEQPVVRSVND